MSFSPRPLDGARLGRFLTQEGSRGEACAPARPPVYRSLYRVQRSCRSVAQPGSAHRSGRWGRRFESSHSDHFAISRGDGRKDPRSGDRLCFLRLAEPDWLIPAQSYRNPGSRVRRKPSARGWRNALMRGIVLNSAAPGNDERGDDEAVPMHILVIDVGGTHVKILATGETDKREFASGPKMTARQMVAGVKRLAQAWKYDVVSIGYPGPVLHNRPVADPKSLGRGWMGFDFKKAFARPVKVVNDAAMQALGSYRKGRMLFLVLGTGLGSTMIVDGIVEPMELAHLPYKKATYED